MTTTLGVLHLFINEILDLTPKSLFNLSNIFLNNNTDGGNIFNVFNLIGADVVEVDSINHNCNLTEAQRIAAIRMSATDGGDGTTAEVSLLADSMLDYSLLGNAATIGMRLNETSGQYRTYHY